MLNYLNKKLQKIYHIKGLLVPQGLTS